MTGGRSRPGPPDRRGPSPGRVSAVTTSPMRSAVGAENTQETVARGTACFVDSDTSIPEVGVVDHDESPAKSESSAPGPREPGVDRGGGGGVVALADHRGRPVAAGDQRLMPSRALVRPVRARPAISTGPASRSTSRTATASASTATATRAPRGAGRADWSRRAGIGGTGARAAPCHPWGQQPTDRRRPARPGPGCRRRRWWHLHAALAEQAGARQAVGVEHVAGDAEHQVVVGRGHPQHDPASEGRAAARWARRCARARWRSRGCRRVVRSGARSAASPRAARATPPPVSRVSTSDGRLSIST